MIMSYGTSNYTEYKKDITRYHFFDDPLENGKDAIDYVTKEITENRKLSGMIFDLTIPGGMGGKEAIKEIREICPDTPVFVASGYSEDPIIAKPNEYGFNASIGKPFRRDELAEMLEKYLEKLT